MRVKPSSASGVNGVSNKLLCRLRLLQGAQASDSRAQVLHEELVMIKVGSQREARFQIELAQSYQDVLDARNRRRNMES